MRYAGEEVSGMQNWEDVAREAERIKRTYGL